MSQSRTVEKIDPRARLAEWERKLEQLPRGERGALVQEFLDRCETARIKVELAARASARRHASAAAERERAFRELQRAWNAVLLHGRARKSASDPPKEPEKRCRSRPASGI